MSPVALSGANKPWLDFEAICDRVAMLYEHCTEPFPVLADGTKNLSSIALKALLFGRKVAPSNSHDSGLF